MDFALSVDSSLRWPKLEPLTARAVLIKMKELGIWNVNVQLKECRLSSLVMLLDKIGRPDLAGELKECGQ